MQATIQYIHSELASRYKKTEIDGFVRLIFEALMGFSYTDMILQKEKKLEKTEISKVNEIVARLKNFEPIQYILGETGFYGLNLKVNSATLIPRPETEELVRWVCDSATDNCNEILDIGTGSGCIALAVKKNLGTASVSGVDISERALQVAKENAVINNVAVDFMQADILNWENYDWREFDIIVSNPPYVRNCEKEQMEKNVLDHEPQLALFVEDNDPLIFYRTIAEFALGSLKDEGMLFFEINEYLGVEMVSLLKSLGYRNIELRKDLNGKDRMLKCRK